MQFKVFTLTALAVATLSQSVYATDLLDIYKEAYAHDPVIHEAEAARDAAVAAIDISTAALLPQIDITGTLTATETNKKPSTGYNTNNTAATAGLSLSQVIWKHSAWVSKTIAEKTAVKTELAYQDALQNLIVRVSNAYFNVLQAAETLEYQQANNAALKQQLEEATRQFQVGVIAETDRLEAQASYDLSNASVISAENALITSYEDLRVLTGKGYTIEDLSKLNLKHFDTPKVEESLKQLMKEAEGNNYALQQAIVARDIAKDNITLAQTGHEPTLSLGASAQTGYTNYSHEVGSSQVDGNSWSNQIGLTLNIPVYHGGEVSATVRQAEANYVSSAQALELAHRNLLTNVNNEFNNVNAAISSVRAYNQSVVSAKSALEATRAGYEVGTRTMTDVLDATQTLYNAMQQAAASRYNYINRRLALAYYDGSLRLSHISDVNASLSHNAKK